jgi:peptidoglycan/xylan/chitin deacetylase (PgdA/CDA1 family)
MQNLLNALRWRLQRIVLLYTLLALAGCVLLHWPPFIPMLVGAALWLMVLDGIFRPGSSIFHATVTHGPRDSRRVAITFDDGPDPHVTPAVLEVLQQHGARATFFVIGRALAAQPELGRRMVGAGHVVANHSWQHAYWQNFRHARWQGAELGRCEETIAAVTGRPSSKLYRPPVGLKIGELGRAISERGLTLVAWSVHSRDTFDPDPARIARRVLSRVRGGDIVLLHDGYGSAGSRRERCPRALALILEGLREKGLECVTVTELLGSPGGTR